MADLNKLTIADARDKLRSGDVTSVALTEACLGAIEGAGTLNAFVHHTPEIALSQAKAADARIAKGDAPAMCGIPLGIKDLFCTKGVPSQAGSRILEALSRNMRAPLVRTCGTRARSCWVSSTWTNSPWDRATRPVFTAMRSTRGGGAMMIRH